MIDYLNRFNDAPDRYVILMAVEGDRWQYYAEATDNPKESLLTIMKKHSPKVVKFRNVRKTEYADKIVSYLRNEYWTTDDGRIKGDPRVIMEDIRNWRPRNRYDAFARPSA